jgi:hypothetical protein
MLPDKLSVDEQLTSLRSGNPSLFLIIGGDGVLSGRCKIVVVLSGNGDGRLGPIPLLPKTKHIVKTRHD